MTGQEPAKVQDYFRRIDEKLDRIIDGMADLKARMSSVEEQLAHVELSVAGVNKRLDRIERRLELREDGETAT